MNCDKCVWVHPETCRECKGREAREFTYEEAIRYEKALSKLYQLTGESFFD